MREIKFRAWDRKEKKLTYMDELNMCFALENHNGNEDENYIILEQYIGLKDSTGKEIYEGDVLNTKTTFKNNMADRRYQDKTIIIVGFLSGCFVDLETGVSVSEKTKCIVYKKIDYEIIGNIHE